MNRGYLLLAAAPLALAAPAYANTSAVSEPTKAEAEAQADAPQEPRKATEELFSTGVAKGRDRLDSATSTSALRAAEIDKIGARSIAEILRDIPGIRAEASTGEGSANITIRGLPIASSGAKFLQLQEDGLPVLEFGDIAFASADTFLRADLNLAAIEAIRGGSASTFASNSPGGIVNFISRTGDVEGGSVQLSGGLDYDMQRIDMDYGAKLSDTVRFHVGGFYREGEGPRRHGYNASKGGQIKFNVTKDFAGGYIRVYGKYLDDKTPAYDVVPLAVTGTSSDPEYRNVPGFDAREDTLFSRYYQSQVTLDANNNVLNDNIRYGQSPKVKSIGVESKFSVAGWYVTEKFRYAGMSNNYKGLYYATFLPAAIAPAQFGAPGGTLRYASGPLAGQTITSPTTINGNGLFTLKQMSNTKVKSLNNAVNDIRASRVWEVGGGNLTTTIGLYSSHQTIDSDWLWSTVFSDVAADGNSALIDVVTATGVRVSQDGTFRFGSAALGGFRRSYRLDTSTNAPFGSVNFHIGKLAIGGSLRYDFGSTTGSVIGAESGGGRVGLQPRDMNGDGVISVAESQVSVLPLSRPTPVDYDYSYLSYSAGVNYRIAEPLAVFGRYSRGGRANADRIQFSPFVSALTGDLLDKDAGVDVVHQAEAGVKYRNSFLTLNLTGFWAKAEDTNLSPTTGAPLVRDYKAMGAEFEGAVRYGVFSMTAGATYTDAEIENDRLNPAIEGNTPQRQAKLIFQAMPQISTDRFSIGAVVIGTTGSFATDENLLKVPGYVTTNAFVQVRPLDRVTLAVNASNVFNELAITAIDDATIPAARVARAHVLNGRTVSASVRFDF